MNSLNSLPGTIQAGFAAAVCAALILVCGCAETKSTAGSAAEHQEPPPTEKRLAGAEVYSMHCARCHPERYPTERTAAQWKTILLHMRVRANLPAEQSRLVLTYLQENSGR